MGSLEHLLGNNCDLTQNWSLVFHVLGDRMVESSCTKHTEDPGPCELQRCSSEMLTTTN